MFSKGGVRSISFDTSGRTLATGGHDGTVRLWDLKDGRELRRFQLRGYVLGAMFTPDERYLITDSENDIHVWSLSDGEQLATLDRRQPKTPSCRYSVAF